MTPEKHLPCPDCDAPLDRRGFLRGVAAASAAGALSLAGASRLLAAPTPQSTANPKPRPQLFTAIAVPYAPASMNPACPKFQSPVYPNCKLSPTAASA